MSVFSNNVTPETLTIKNVIKAKLKIGKKQFTDIENKVNPSQTVASPK